MLADKYEYGGEFGFVVNIVLLFRVTYSSVGSSNRRYCLIGVVFWGRSGRSSVHFDRIFCETGEHVRVIVLK